MPDLDLPHYTFVPWLRRGAANRIDEADALGAVTSGARGRANVDVELVVHSAAVGGEAAAPLSVVKAVQLLGPGDVLGFRRDAVVRTEPPPDSTSFTASALACLELYDEDFPWRYTPARAATASEDPSRRYRLRPWIALWVLQEGEYAWHDGTESLPARVELTPAAIAGALPPSSETWAWAHVQLAAQLEDPALVPAAIAAAPDQSIARLLCPRKLEADRAYLACVVPAFEAGRLAGLGRPRAEIEQVFAQQPSWGVGATPKDHPVYFSWRFRTSASGDFETLAGLLQPRPCGERFGKRAMNVANPGFGLDGVASHPTVELEGALQPASMPRQTTIDAVGERFLEKLRDLLDVNEALAAGEGAGKNPFYVPGSPDAFAEQLADDPIVVPPTYGRLHAGVDRLDELPAEKEWVAELNLDPRQRVPAGLGTRVVQDRQEELVERAWRQVGDLLAVNRRLREAELTVTVSDQLFAKHVESADDNRFVMLTAAAQHGLQGSEPIAMRHQVEQSKVPLAAQSAAFKRITRPQGKLIRRLSGIDNLGGFHRDLLPQFNGALSAAPPAPDPAVAVGMTQVLAGVEAARQTFVAEKSPRPRQVFAEVLWDALTARLGGASGAGLAAAVQTIAVPDLVADVKARAEARLAQLPSTEAVPLRIWLSEIADSIRSVGAPDGANVQVTITSVAFAKYFGKRCRGRNYRGVIVAGEALPAALPVLQMIDAERIEQFQDALGEFKTSFLDATKPSAPPPQLAPVDALKRRLVDQLRPRQVLVRRVGETIQGLPPSPPPSPGERPLRAVMAYPVFDEGQFEWLRRISQDFVIPNFGELPADTLTLLEPNRRFIQAFMAGLNHEMGRELLWREYPTDQRGSYFRKFWDTHDNPDGVGATDVAPLHEWAGVLGQQSSGASAYLVLVVRGELLRKYPDTVVYAQKATFDGGNLQAARLLSADPADTKFPVFQGALEPDIALFGFELDVAVAKGDRAGGLPGWFFVLQERPGQPTFGLDDGAGPPDWPSSPDDLAWKHVARSPDGGSCISVEKTRTQLSSHPESTELAARWGVSSADLASLLLQNPVIVARHASEMLP